MREYGADGRYLCEFASIVRGTAWKEWSLRAMRNCWMPQAVFVWLSDIRICVPATRILLLLACSFWAAGELYMLMRLRFVSFVSTVCTRIILLPSLLHCVFKSVTSNEYMWWMEWLPYVSAIIHEHFHHLAIYQLLIAHQNFLPLLWHEWQSHSMYPIWKYWIFIVPLCIHIKYVSMYL